MTHDCVLSRVQNEVAEWATQFGDNPSHHPDYAGVKLFSIPPFLGMVEEVGELAGPMAKRHQGRGYMDEAQYREAIEDGLADLLIFACDFARREDVNLADALSKTWEKVKRRRQASWEADKAKEADKVADCSTGPRVIVGPLITGLKPGDTEPCQYCNKLAVYTGTEWKHLSDAMSVLEQNGQGWAEPPDDTTTQEAMEAQRRKEAIDTEHDRRRAAAPCDPSAPQGATALSTVLGLEFEHGGVRYRIIGRESIESPRYARTPWQCEEIDDRYPKKVKHFSDAILSIAHEGGR